MERSVVCENEPIKIYGNESIRVRGRHTEKDGCLAVDWTNSGFAFNFSGTGFIITLGSYSWEQPAYIKITVDGTRRQRFAVVNGEEKLIIEGLTDKRHRVEVLKVTESDTPILFDSLILLGVGAALRNPPFNSPRRIEFIGDSITAGYGVLGPSWSPSYMTYQQDGTYSYAALTAEKCGAEARYICNSGKGIACDCLGNRESVKAVEYYAYQTRLGGECNDGWTPDVVVINIGTNDGFGGASDEEFETAARKMITLVHSRYPEAHIVWVYGMMSHIYSELLRKLIRELSKTDKKLHFLCVSSCMDENGEIGANGHPNVRASMRVSSLLCKKIRAVTGWRTAVSVPDEE